MEKCAYKEKALLANLLQDKDRAKEIAESLCSFVHPQFMALLTGELEAAQTCAMVFPCSATVLESIGTILDIHMPSWESALSLAIALPYQSEELAGMLTLGWENSWENSLTLGWENSRENSLTQKWEDQLTGEWRN